MTVRPTGAVTFLFTDLEGSTRAWEDDPTGMAAALEVHDRVLRHAIESHGGFVFATGGDSFSAAFSTPTNALRAAVESQRRLAESGCGLRVRIGVHSGEAVERNGNYFGPSLNRTARLTSVGHGGQILVSNATTGLVDAAGYSFRDLGEHRLSDLATPTRIAQLIADGIEESFPPLRSAVATDNLPPLGDVFGRTEDMRKLIGLLGHRRLVTLTGAGGIGKSTLAISVAGRMTSAFRDGRWLIDLTDLPGGTDQAGIAAAVATVDERFRSIEALAPRRMLLIMDNCEHVIDGVSSYMSDLLATAPEVRVLATSREPLHVPGEQVIVVGPLSVEEGPQEAPAVELFLAQATEAGVTLDSGAERDTIVGICRELGGLPLAIKLAAARTAVMTPRQILDRLADRLSVLRGGHAGPEHHHTIEATIAWSYDYLDPDAQHLLRFLSVFLGGFDLDQAEAVGGSGTLDRLAGLVTKSLVHRSDDRFGMLESVRQYAATRLEEAGEEAEAHRLHFEFFADWAHHVYHRAERIVLSDRERRWITDNLSNMRKAVRHGAERGDITPAAELAVVLWPHWLEILYGRSDQEDWCEPLLVHLDRLEPRLQIGVLHGSGTIALVAGDVDRAQRLLRAELDLCRSTGLASSAPNNLGELALSRDQWDEAERLYEEGIEVMRRNRLPHHSPSGNLAFLHCWYRGNPSRALAILREARTGDRLALPWEVKHSQMSEALTLIGSGDDDRAQELLTDSLAYFREKRIRFDEQARALQLLALIAHRNGDTPLSANLLLEAIDLRSNEGLSPIWRDWDDYDWGAALLAQVLLDLNEPRSAGRVLNEYRAGIAHNKPWVLAPLQEQEARLASFIVDPIPDDDIPLIDAIREALTG